MEGGRPCSVWLLLLIIMLHSLYRTSRVTGIPTLPWAVLALALILWGCGLFCVAEIYKLVSCLHGCCVKTGKCAAIGNLQPVVTWLSFPPTQLIMCLGTWLSRIPVLTPGALPIPVLTPGMSRFWF